MAYCSEKTETKEGADTVTASKSKDEKTSDSFHTEGEIDHLVATDVMWFLKVRGENRHWKKRHWKNRHGRIDTGRTMF